MKIRLFVRKPSKQYDQLLVICSLKEIVLSVQSAVPDNWQVSWLIDPRITSAFPNKTLFSDS